MDFGNAIKKVRREKKIKQKELSALTGLSVNSISEMELGKTFPQKDSIKKISKALDVPDSYLFFLSLTEEDVAEDKRQVFRVLKNSLSELILNEAK